MLFRISLLLFSLFIAKQNGLAQYLLSEEELESSQTFYSLEEALDNKEFVYVLDLRSKQLKNINAISKLKKLQILLIDGNELTTLPKSISKCKHLQVIKASRNQFVKLPNSIVKLKYLEVLELRQNSLEVLPKLFKNLSALKELDLRDNKLTKFPEDACYPP